MGVGLEGEVTEFVGRRQGRYGACSRDALWLIGTIPPTGWSILMGGPVCSALRGGRLRPDSLLTY